MIVRRLLALAIAAAALLPAAAQAHWVGSCGCQRVHDSYWRYHHRHHWLHERTSLAVELTKNVFAVPYRLRPYPYVNFRGGMAGAYPAVASGLGDSQAREIDADAKVTILGPNRMDIKLYRKGRGTLINPR